MKSLNESKLSESDSCNKITILTGEWRLIWNYRVYPPVAKAVLYNARTYSL